MESSNTVSKLRDSSNLVSKLRNSSNLVSKLRDSSNLVSKLRDSSNLPPHILMRACSTSHLCWKELVAVSRMFRKISLKNTWTGWGVNQITCQTPHWKVLHTKAETCTVLKIRQKKTLSTF